MPTSSQLLSNLKDQTRMAAILLLTALVAMPAAFAQPTSHQRLGSQEGSRWVNEEPCPFKEEQAYVLEAMPSRATLRMQLLRPVGAAVVPARAEGYASYRFRARDAAEDDGSKTWWYVAGGAAAVALGITAMVLLGGGGSNGGSPDIPPPPGRP